MTEGPQNRPEQPHQPEQAPETASPAQAADAGTPARGPQQAASPADDPTVVLAAHSGTTAGAPPRRARAARALRSPVARLVAAGVAGLVIGGTAVALVDGDGRGRDLPLRAAVGGDRGPGPHHLRPGAAEDGMPGRGGPFRDRLEHHHGPNGEVIPGPAEEGTADTENDQDSGGN